MDKASGNHNYFSAVAVSGGKDSTAMFLLMIEKEMPIDCVLYADTGMEEPRIVDIYRLQGLAEMHCYLKTAHQFDPAEVEALLQFADPLNVAYYCGEMNTHKYSFPICDLLRETNAKESFELAKPELSKKLSVREQLHAAMKQARQQPAQEERIKGGEAR